MEETSLNELRSLILSKTSIQEITPADCKRISKEISQSLNKNVSETTLKRLFGFAAAEFNFSRYTLTALSEYVEQGFFKNYGLVKQLEQTPVPLTWKEIRSNAIRLTETTLKIIKNRSGMPYHLTTSRVFSETDFNAFYESNYSFMCFIAPPNYGKTIMLSHLAQKFLSNTLPEDEHSALLYVKARYLFLSDDKYINFEDQLKHQLGIHPSESLINHAIQNYKKTGGKLVVFLDGFPDLDLTGDLKIKLFESIRSFITAIENNKAIQLVMNMRPCAWKKFNQMGDDPSFLENNWFKGSYYHLDPVSNIPEFTEQEVDKILSKIHSENKRVANPELKAQLKFGFHMQLYYELNEDVKFTDPSNLTFSDVTALFVRNKIYKSNYCTEKIYFLQRLIQLTNFGAPNTSASKEALLNGLDAFKNAYNELLYDGILTEEADLENPGQPESVRFIHADIYEYFLGI